MSTIHHACCCGGEASSCPTSSCPCNSSYTATGIDFDYDFQHNIGLVNCATCLNLCLRHDYSMSVNIVQSGPIVLTRQVCPQTGTCGWYGAGTVLASGTVSWSKQRICSNALNRTCSETFTFNDVEVPCCIHVTCAVGPGEGCAGTLVPAGQLYYLHKLEICDFAIQCNDVSVCGSRNLVTEPCAEIDCDNQLNCDSGVNSLWCNGGHFTWISKYKCLENIVTGDWQNRGFYQGGSRCQNPCTPYSGASSTLDATVAAFGPFSTSLREECGQDPTTCVLAGFGGSPYPHLVGPASVRDELRSYCGTVDSSTPIGPAGCPNEDILQTHSFSRWLYA